MGSLPAMIEGAVGCGAVLAVLAGAALAADQAAGQAAEHPSLQAQVARRKALFIEQFTRLVEWPAAALSREGPFVLCVQGRSETADELTRIAAFRRFKDRPCQVRQLRSPSGVEACHLLYLAGSEGPRLPETLKAVAARPVLTVGDTPGFVQRGVQFNLFEEVRPSPPRRTPAIYVGFELSVPAVKRSVLGFDPRLLSSGRRVDTASGDAAGGAGP
jgi:hypothetical protein